MGNFVFQKVRTGVMKETGRGSRYAFQDILGNGTFRGPKNRIPQPLYSKTIPEVGVEGILNKRRGGANAGDCIQGNAKQHGGGGEWGGPYKFRVEQ